MHTPTPDPTPPRWNVFLSSTVRDMRAYRKGVKAALDHAQVECYPSEDWVNTWQETEAACKKSFDQCNSYLLLLGYWYGSELPHKARTVTQEEFRWACERSWTASPTPMAVFVPEEDSEADLRLREMARRLCAKLPGDDARKRHEAQVDAWHREVLGSWKTASSFSDVNHLRESVLVLLRFWDPGARRDATAVPANDPGVPCLGKIDLGLLCRADHFKAVRRARTAAQVDQAPALGLLVHGDRDCGGDPFLQRLAVKELKCGALAVGEVPMLGADLALVVTTVAQLLGLTLGAEATPAALAERIALELKNQPLSFVLGRCAVLPGGVGAVEGTFWQPLHAALAGHHAQQPIAHRLTAVFADFSGKAEAWIAARGAVAAGQRQRLLPVPALALFDRVGLVEGFEDLGIAAHQHATLTERAMKDEAGDDDPVPVRVLGRLLDQPIQYEEDTHDLALHRQRH